ncbi:hypothetical protein Ddc_22859 [Ditylenchus destructor]|nr:hypothetical protein Ddc_22859 [Ditylenchus destructor]
MRLLAVFAFLVLVVLIILPEANASIKNFKSLRGPPRKSSTGEDERSVRGGNPSLAELPAFCKPEDDLCNIFDDLDPDSG